MIYFILCLSLTINIICCWFIYSVLVRQSDLVAIVEDIQYKIFIFSRHLQQLYELPMYYGEPTIQNLIEHSKALLSSFEEFNQDYISFDGEGEYEQLQEKTEDEERSS